MPIYKFKRTEITTEQEIAKLVQSAPDEWMSLLVAILYLVGCRISEALNLKKRNVWTDGKSLVVEIGVLKRKDTSTGPYQNLPHLIHVRIDAPFVREVVLPSIDALPSREDFLFPSPKLVGRHLSRQLAWRRLKDLMHDISPHVFRHDRLMKLAMKGASEAQLMDWAGWTDARPAGNYIRVTGRLAAELSDKVD